MTKARHAFRRQLEAGSGSILAAGVGDAGQARLVERVGYPAVYISGSYVNHTRGYPDGTLTLSEIAQRISEVADRVNIPVIADADEGFGSVLKIARTVHEFERAGAAALHLEDFAIKKHGLPLPVQDMVTHLKVALDTRTDPDMLIIARTDAMSPWRDGIHARRAACEEEAFERALRYCDAGADAIMPLFATNSWLERYGPRIPKPLVVLGGAPKNWGAEAAGVAEPEKTASELLAWNVRMVIYATNMLSRAHRFMTQEYGRWLQDGKFDVRPTDETDRADANVLVGLPEKERILQKYPVG
ncbi:isocitrate lyase/PEP mutase family protein [Bordetella bronchiseptica]|uniref:isocitrate lyase/PEP mutase family protein n=1 Tax=Bordetella bronchiseptica TaxID=518 RepID=UPI0004596FDF|nr:isocitrate lyase/PEP mutase family protein [Bordetella bronchiseptica]AZW29203.1 hypothetical protein CS343_02770 [Bordetella bronchiseptica]KCV45645.1 putative methylisocitrate lyase [Bordetella bronchiseptica 345]KDC46971.1 putative methylisocitrate lyase [Bordetella bronchiseptica M85/00/2]